MGHEPLTKWVVLGVVLAQILLAALLRNTRPLSPTFILSAYALGGTLNHNLFLAIHEITHNLAFKGIKANKALAIFANLPIGIPYCAMFKVRFPILAGRDYLLTLHSSIRGTTWNTTSTRAKTGLIPTCLPGLSS